MDDEEEKESIPQYIKRNALHGVLRRRLKILLEKDLNSREIAKELGVTPQYVPYLIKKNGFSLLWAQNRERRKLKNKNRPRVLRMRWKITQKVLDEFEKRGYQVTRGKIADTCYIEGLPIAIFSPKRPFLIKSLRYPTKYFKVQSKYLYRFVIVILPNGKWEFFFPKKTQKYLHIPEWRLDTPEEWPTKVELRKQRLARETDTEIKKVKKKKLKDAGVAEADIWRLLGFDEAPA